jgi:hypothetical protein
VNFVAVRTRWTRESLVEAEEIRLDGPPQVHRRDSVSLGGWSCTPSAEVYQRLRRDPGWRVRTLPIGHNVAAAAPEALVRFLLEE